MNRDDEMRGLRLYVESLEQAIRDTDEALRDEAGIGLVDYLSLYEPVETSMRVVQRLLED